MLSDVDCVKQLRIDRALIASDCGELRSEADFQRFRSIKTRIPQ
jgi:hypothetical protein